MKKFLVFLVTTTLAVGVVYGSYWVVKNVSYTVFYESMVIKTISENVKPSCIKN